MTKTREISRYVPAIESLRALAHPDRLRIIGLLRIDGPSTATLLGRRLGLNSGATSYHLRQLQAHGFIEPATELGNRRERWWRSRHESTEFDTAALEGDALEAGLAFTQAILSRHAAQMQRAHDTYRDLAPDWRKAVNTSDFVVPLTADAAANLNEKIMAVLWKAKAAAPAPGEPLPPGTRPVTFILYAFPTPDIEQDR